jgi:hypothetical protein
MHEPDQTAFEFDRHGTEVSVCEAVTEAVAHAAGVDPIEVEPLYSVLDPDALEALVRPRPTDGGEVTVAFPLDDYHVTVWSGGRIHVSATPG